MIAIFLEILTSNNDTEIKRINKATVHHNLKYTVIFICHIIHLHQIQSVIAENIYTLIFSLQIIPAHYSPSILGSSLL